MNDIEFLKLALNEDEIGTRPVLAYGYQITHEGKLFTIAADGYVMHVVNGHIYEDGGNVIALQSCDLSHLDKALVWCDKSYRGWMEQLINPKRDNPIGIDFETSRLKRILEYAGDDPNIAIIIRPKNNNAQDFFDFTDEHCTATIHTYDAAFFLGSVRGDVSKEVTIKINPLFIRRVLPFFENCDPYLMVDGDDPYKPVFFGTTTGNFVIMMPFKPVGE